MVRFYYTLSILIEVKGQLEGQSSWTKSSDTFIKNKANQNFIASDDYHMGNDYEDTCGIIWCEEEH